MQQFLKYIWDEHTKLRKLMTSLEEKTMRSDKGSPDIFSDLKQLLVPHLKAEEEIFYPMLLDIPKARIDAFEALEEHRVIGLLISDLDGLEDDKERLLGQLRVLRGQFLRHADEEEDRLYQFARNFPKRWFDDALNRFKEAEAEVRGRMPGSRLADVLRGGDARKPLDADAG